MGESWVHHKSLRHPAKGPPKSCLAEKQDACTKTPQAPRSYCSFVAFYFEAMAKKNKRDHGRAGGSLVLDA